MRESENVIGRIKNEQKGTVLERGMSVRKVDGPQCSHVSQTRPPPPDPTKTVGATFSRHAIMLLHFFILCLGFGFH